MPKLIVIKGSLKGQVFDLGSKDVVFCGRYPRMNDIAILEIAVSRKHFKIFKIGRDYFVEDLNSKHGTLVNDEIVDPGEGFQVNEGDLIAVGNTVMRLIEVNGKGSLVKALSIPQDSSKEQPKKDRRSAKELELIYNVSELLKNQMNFEEFFDAFIKLVLEALPRIDNASVFLFENKNHDKIEFAEIFSSAHDKTISKYKKKILKKVIREHKTLRMSNTDFELPESYIKKGETLEIKSLLCVPITIGKELLGIIYIDSGKPYGFRKKDQLLLNSLVGPLAVAIEKNRLDGKMVPDKTIPFKEKLIKLIKKN